MVGMSVAQHPPRRSVRAALPHTASASGQTPKRSVGYGCVTLAVGTASSVMKFDMEGVEMYDFN